LLVRNLLYRMDKETWLKCTRDLFAYMTTLPDVAFMSAGAYTAHTLRDQTDGMVKCCECGG
jgi:hypothetical protein